MEDEDVQATRIAPTGAQRPFSPDEILVTKTNSDDVIVYANDDHGVSVNVADRNRRIIDWFRRHMR